MRHIFAVICSTFVISSLTSSTASGMKATVKESIQTIRTYPFSDPDPVAKPSERFYPYFRFDGFSAEGTDKEWKVITLENDYILVRILPEIGGKVWGATDKTTGRDFIYTNHVIKFRDIAMRGPWTSGGIEYNFGIVGHAPTTSNPVDYVTKELEDGSVSCYVSSYEWLTRTLWTVEINLPKDKAYFTTTTTWYNASSVVQPYYQWMNAGYPAAGNAQFCYPGDTYVGHDGDVHPFPRDENGHDISWYRKNAFDGAKSYHIVGQFQDFYGCYWHDYDFGTVHHANHDEKLGMKMFLWAQSRQGAIWEDLLTDNDGQYVELQSGRMFNQPTEGSAYTPFKNFSFAPQATDRWTEYWYPVKGTKGIGEACKIGALNVERDGGLTLYFSPVCTLETNVKIFDSNKLVKELPLSCKPLETWTVSVPELSVPNGRLHIEIGDGLLSYSDIPEEIYTNRPKTLPSDFDWESAYGLYSEGQQWMNQMKYDKAEQFFLAAIDKEAYLAPALNGLASLYYREGRYEEALEMCRKVLSTETYQGDANYIYGLSNMALGRNTDAKDGFALASYSLPFRSAAYEKLSEMYLIDGNWIKAKHYAEMSLQYNCWNLGAKHVLMVACRKLGRYAEAESIGNAILEKLPLFHAARFEKTLLESSGIPENVRNSFSDPIRNELSFETYMELAGWYESAGLTDETLELLSYIQEYPIANYRRAYILDKRGNEKESRDALALASSQSPEFVFPFRAEDIIHLQWASSKTEGWKEKYYLALTKWACRDMEGALDLLSECNDADYGPLFLSRALLKSGDERLADIRRAEHLNPGWRTGFALQNYYSSTGEWQEAAKFGKEYFDKYPDNYYIGLKYAKALCEVGEFRKCTSLLGKLRVLPNEGARAGREVFREANLYQAIDNIHNRKYAQAGRNLNASMNWPENLGVGKPYDNMIDWRLENFLQAKILQGQGLKEEANYMFGKVVDTAPMTEGVPVPGALNLYGRGFNSGNLLCALALREMGREGEAVSMVDSWAVNYPGNTMAEWCSAAFYGRECDAPSKTDSNFSLIDRLCKNNIK